MQNLRQPPPKMNIQINDRPTLADSDDSAPPDDSRTAGDPCARFVESGDVLGLLDWLRSRSVLRLPASAMDNLAKAIRRLESKDVDALVETAYAEIVGLIATLLIRSQMHIERRLAEADGCGGDPTHMPADLVEEDWFGRIERLTRFLMQVTTTRERVRHLTRLHSDARKSSINFNWVSGNPMDSDPYEAENREGATRNGRGHRAKNRIAFP